MCGITGGWWSNPGHAHKRISNSLKKIKHRGPDDDGYQFYPVGSAVVALGHTRLSIIDLTDSGHQPMHSADGRWTIVFNGEVYNYRELRAQLRGMGYTFNSDSDTEVLLTAWGHWGVDCLPRLVGMFAFAILDKVNATLTCARDAFGIKPFFYSADIGQFVFSSELPALLELLQSKPHLNWQRSYDYLVHGDYDSSAATFYDGIYHLEPGHWLQVNINTGRVMPPQRWWQPKIEEKEGWKFEDAVDEVRENFLQNIRLHMRSDVTLGAALSGGVDSSAVVCAMRYVEPTMPIKTFSFIAGTSDISEEGWVDLVNQHVGAISHKVRVTPKELVTDLDKMIQAQGEPFGSTSIYAQFRVYQMARENGIKVMLDGQGADEMLAGYIGYPGKRLRSLIETWQLNSAYEFWRNWSSWPGRNHMMAARYLATEMTNGRVYELLRKIDGKENIPRWINREILNEYGVNLRKKIPKVNTSIRGRRVMDELKYSLTTRGLNGLLRHADRNSMIFGIESRVPFLTHGMAELLLTMPEDYLISKMGETKHIFRHAMKGIVPEVILNRKDKIGFATDEINLINGMSGEPRHWIIDNLNLPFINKKQLICQFDSIMLDKRSYSWQVWRWINFARWQALFGV